MGLGLMSLVCGVRVSCSCIHVVLGVACTRVIVSWSCIHVNLRVLHIGDMVLLHTCHSWSGTYWRLGVVLLHSGMYWRHGALAYMSLMKWHVLETWCRALAYMALMK